MKTKKSQNLVAGRLTGALAEPPEADPGDRKRAGGYGGSRLGITADEETRPAQVAEVAPAKKVPAPRRPAPHPPAVAKPKRPQPERPAKAKTEAPRHTPAEAAAPSPKATVYLSPPRPLATGGLNRRIVLPVAASVGAVLILLIWLLWGSSGSETDRPPAAAAAADKRPAVGSGSTADAGRAAEAAVRVRNERAAPAARERSGAPDAAVSRSRPPQRPYPAHKPNGPASRPAPKGVPAGTSRKNVLSLLEWARLLAGRKDLRAKVRSGGTAADAPKAGRPGPGRPGAPGKQAAPSKAPGKTSKSGQPTQPWQYVPCPSGIKLSGIVRHPDGILANINGRFVRVGDTISGAKVVRITPLSVEMQREGKRFLVGFSKPEAPSRTEEPADDQAAGETTEQSKPAEKGEPDKKAESKAE